jgi:hypothetical protein
MIGMRLQPDELAALDKAVADQNGPGATRAGTAAAMVVQMLIEERFLPEQSE